METETEQATYRVTLPKNYYYHKAVNELCANYNPALPFDEKLGRINTGLEIASYFVRLYEHYRDIHSEVDKAREEGMQLFHKYLLELKTELTETKHHPLAQECRRQLSRGSCVKIEMLILKR